MRLLVWVCRLLLVVIIGSFVGTVFYLTHDVAFPEGVRAALNWITVAASAVVGLAWPFMRRYWQALLLLIGLLAFRLLFGENPSLFAVQDPSLLTPFQSDFLWVPIGVTAASLIGTIVFRAIVSDRNLQAMRQAASTVTTGSDVAAETEVALQETSAPEVPTEPMPVPAPSEAADTAVESPAPEEVPAAEEAPKETKKKK